MNQSRNFFVKCLQYRIKEGIFVFSLHKTTKLNVGKDIKWNEVGEEFEVKLLANLLERFS